MKAWKAQIYFQIRLASKQNYKQSNMTQPMDQTDAILLEENQEG
jgi:hypothetical protein